MSPNVVFNIFTSSSFKAVLQVFWLMTGRGYFYLNSLILSLLIDVSKQMVIWPSISRQNWVNSAVQEHACGG